VRVAEREKLPNRREAETFDVEAGGLRYRATIGRYDDGRLAEIFLVNHKAGSQAGIMASDAAVVASIALQYGVPLDVIRHALMRDSRGKPSGPLGVVLDRLVDEGTT
jgi:hypothetical protein